MYVAVENIPNSYYLTNAKFCYKNKNEIFYINYFAINFWCKEQHSGRYLLIFQDRKKFLIFMELYVFGRKLLEEEKTGK